MAPAPATPLPPASAQGFSDDGGLWHGMPVVARGAHRVCVLDPVVHGHCLKYPLPVDPAVRRPLRHRLREAWARLVPRRQANALELRAWRHLHARLGDRLDGRVARCVDLVATPAGQALRCALVVDAGGTPAPSLYDLLSGASRGRYHADALCDAVTRFETWLHAHAVPLFDLNSGNLVVVERAGIPELVCVDVKSVLGGKEIVPVSRWSRGLMQRKITRRADRLRARIRAHAPLAATQDAH
ncbi:hypothetical protein E5843_09870 [Luteimonas yindakuii]|uniref:YrbL family protein n=1 Tax=Luteimonas yindakuii TaxID=2565782 RepID=UPI0011078EC5|nr:YrbL family protein [Luteimonas yindakuii]QCU72643.1 hypothetical protein E5843_09870 [Luteimonas yindakuii]